MTSLYLAHAFDLLPYPILIVGAKGESVFANKSFCELVGQAPTELPVFVNKIIPDYDQLLAPGEHTTTLIYGATGEHKKVRISSQRLPSGECLFEVIGASASALSQSKRLETLGLLAGGVAHDFNNILAGILGHATYLKTILGVDTEAAHTESLLAIEEGGNRAASLSSQVLSFAKADPAERAKGVSLKDFLERTTRLLKGAVGRDYPLLLETQALTAETKVLGIEAQLTQVVCNLVINARDASAVGSTITIRTHYPVADALLLTLFGKERPASKYVGIEVVDNGTGMSEATLAKVFEPFFTTKERGKGTGLGLTMVQQLVHDMGGKISIQTELGKGTCVMVVLPEVAEETDNQKRRAQGKRRLAGGDERILVVDDDHPVRAVLDLSLTHLGYTVDTVTSGAGALAKYTSPGAYDAVLLDMVMPQMSGEEVFESLRNVDPAVRVLIMSGYTTEDSIRRVMAAGAKGFIPKPFTIELLSEKLRSVLDL